jgi:hypothetical protein
VSIAADYCLVLPIAADRGGIGDVEGQTVRWLSGQVYLEEALVISY